MLKSSYNNTNVPDGDSLPRFMSLLHIITANKLTSQWKKNVILIYYFFQITNG